MVIFTARLEDRPTTPPSLLVICAVTVVEPEAITVNGIANWVREFAGICSPIIFETRRREFNVINLMFTITGTLKLFDIYRW